MGRLCTEFTVFTASSAFGVDYRTKVEAVTAEFFAYLVSRRTKPFNRCILQCRCSSLANDVSIFNVIEDIFVKLVQDLSLPNKLETL
jgi:hypothetical protein